MNELEKYRKKIDKVDEKIIELVSKRTGYVFQIARYKARRNIMIVDEKREKEIIDNIKKHANDNDISAEFAEKLYKVLVEYCNDIQRIRH